MQTFAAVVHKFLVFLWKSLHKGRAVQVCDEHLFRGRLFVLPNTHGDSHILPHFCYNVPGPGSYAMARQVEVTAEQDIAMLTCPQLRTDTRTYSNRRAMHLSLASDAMAPEAIGAELPHDARCRRVGKRIPDVCSLSNCCQIC